jgi:hypothetical protein
MRRNNLTWATGGILLALLFSGCSHGPAPASSPATLGEQKTFDLKEIPSELAASFLVELSLGTASAVPERNAIAVSGSAGDLYRAGIVLSLVDTSEPYLIETLAPVSDARTVPTNGQIAEALGASRSAHLPSPRRQASGCG